MPGRSRDDGQQSSELWGAQPAYGQDGVDVSSDRKRLRYCNPITKESEQRCRADPGTTDSSRASSGGRNPLMGKMGWTCIQSFKDAAWLGNLASVNGMSRFPLSRSALLLTAVLMLAAPVDHAQPKAANAFEQNRKLGRGVNILGYDPIWRSRDQARFQDKHFRLLKEAGFNSVRINLQPFRRMNPANGYVLSESWFEVLDWAVRQAQAQDLRVILDLHEYNSLGNDPVTNKAKFLAFWRQLSAHCQAAPESVLFEMLNEPSRKLTPALWNEYLAEALAIIREKNPTRAVIRSE